MAENATFLLATMSRTDPSSCYHHLVIILWFVLSHASDDGTQGSFAGGEVVGCEFSNVFFHERWFVFFNPNPSNTDECPPKFYKVNDGLIYPYVPDGTCQPGTKRWELATEVECAHDATIFHPMGACIFHWTNWGWERVGKRIWQTHRHAIIILWFR
jgi:hypothetical protein